MELLKVENIAHGSAYNIIIARGLLDSVGKHLAELFPDLGKVVVVSDENVFALYGERVIASLTGAPEEVASVIIPPGEASKTLGRLDFIYERFGEIGLKRDGLVIALGGGVVGDIAGLAAATWMRGVPLVQLPTTLLAQTDSSVGGKTAIDTAAGKNMVGVFYRPSLVLADTDFLSTLPPREYASGMAEVIKYGAIASPQILSELERIAASPDPCRSDSSTPYTPPEPPRTVAPPDPDRSDSTSPYTNPEPPRIAASPDPGRSDSSTLPPREYASGMAEVIKYGAIASPQILSEPPRIVAPPDPDRSDSSTPYTPPEPPRIAAPPDPDRSDSTSPYITESLIAACCKIKADIVSEDEFDTGRRQLLNFGHTFGHAIEAKHGFAKYTHGEAVAQGMVIASVAGELLGITQEGTADYLRDLLTSFDLPVRDIKTDGIMPLIMHDKKSASDSVSIILLDKIGSAKIVRKTFDEIADVLDTAVREGRL